MFLFQRAAGRWWWRARAGAAIVVAAAALGLASIAGCGASVRAPEEPGEAGAAPDDGSEDDTGEPIKDAPRLSVTDTRVPEDGGALRFTVTLDPHGARIVTVDYTTSDATAVAGADYESAAGILTFSPGSTTRTVDVSVTDDREDEEDEHLRLTLSNPHAATLASAAAIGTIVDDEPPAAPPVPSPPDRPLPDRPLPNRPPELASLTVTGAGRMYPAFDRRTRHYAVPCAGGTAVTVNARSAYRDARLTLLRSDPAASVSEVDTLNAALTVNPGHHLALEVRTAAGTETYVVHCVPTDFPTIRILTKSAGASEGLLFISADIDHLRTPDYDMIVDYNGVPRYYLKHKGWNFRPHADGPTIGGKRVRYSLLTMGAVHLLDANFNEVHVARYADLDYHDFVLGAHSYLFIRYVPAERSSSPWRDPSETWSVVDSVITEVPYDGSDPVHWNSWDHLKILPDCQYHPSYREGEYAHLNSLQVVDGGVIASFYGCGQVLGIDWSSATGAVEWQVGGSSPPRSSATRFLEIVGDPLDGFCGQHHATLSGNRLLLFDNGTYCTTQSRTPPVYHRSPRNTRVVEYDISSGTQARFTREYRRPKGHGHSRAKGSVTLLDNGNWLIGWGGTKGAAVARNAVAVVTEVDTTGTAVFHMNLTSDRTEAGVVTPYRVYREDAAAVAIPRNLP